MNLRVFLFNKTGDFGWLPYNVSDKNKGQFLQPSHPPIRDNAACLKQSFSCSDKDNTSL